MQHWRELGDDRFLDGEDDLARAAYERALELCRRHGDPVGESELLRRLAHLEGGDQSLARMRSRLLEARDRARLSDDRFSEAMALIDLAEVALRQGEDRVRGRLANEARRLLREIAGGYGMGALLRPTDLGKET